MRKGNRIKVVDEDSFFHDQEGLVVKRDRYYIHVKLDSHPYVVKFTDEELQLITSEKIGV